MILPLLLSALQLATAPAPGPQLALEGTATGGYAHAKTEGDDFGEFLVDRARAGAAFSVGDVGGVALRCEAVRSAGPQSLYGVDGNSLLLRVDRAFGHAGIAVGPGRLSGSLGLVPDPWVETLEGAYDLRGEAPTLAEGSRLYDTADLGATIGWAGLDGLVELQLAASNGEGRRELERNPGKDLAAILTVRPLRFDTARGPAAFGLHLTGRDGSFGPGSAGDHRAAAAATLLSTRAGGGVEWVRAIGSGGDGALLVDGWGGWLGGELVAPVGAFARFDRLRTAVGVRGSEVELLRAGIYGDLVEHVAGRTELRLWLAYEHQAFGPEAAPLPGGSSTEELHRVVVLLSGSAVQELVGGGS